MDVGMGRLRTVGLAAVTTLVASGLGVWSAPTAHAADPSFPGPDSASWLAVQKAAAPHTDGAGEVANDFLDLTATGGTSGNAVAFVHADLQHAFFRFHVAAEFPSGGTGAFIVQFDTDSNAAGWERALRYEPATGTVAVFSSDANSPVNAKGTLVSSTALPTANKRSYPGTSGGGHVAFALSRNALSSAGISLGAPMVIGTTIESQTDFGAALNASTLLGLGNAKADILGAGKVNPAWQNVASDPFDIDSDGDGVADRVDNCPVVSNPGQEDDDAALEATYPPNHPLDGTEGRGNACDSTPRGQDLIDGDGVGELDDDCPEQYGALANGCVAQSTTTATLRYAPRRKVFKGAVRADYDQCLPRRTVTVFRSVSGPDKQIGNPVKTDAVGKYALPRLSRRPKAGKYYASVDSKWTLGARCFAVKSPKIQVG